MKVKEAQRFAHLGRKVQNTDTAVEEARSILKSRSLSRNHDRRLEIAILVLIYISTGQHRQYTFNIPYSSHNPASSNYDVP